MRSKPLSSSRTAGARCGWFHSAGGVAGCGGGRFDLERGCVVVAVEVPKTLPRLILVPVVDASVGVGDGVRFLRCFYLCRLSPRPDLAVAAFWPPSPGEVQIRRCVRDRRTRRYRVHPGRSDPLPAGTPRRYRHRRRAGAEASQARFAAVGAPAPGYEVASLVAGRLGQFPCEFKLLPEIPLPSSSIIRITDVEFTLVVAAILYRRSNLAVGTENARSETGKGWASSSFNRAISVSGNSSSNRPGIAT